MNKLICQTLRTVAAVVLAICASVNMHAQTGVEYFFDSDPGYGKATRIAFTPDENGHIGFAVPTEGLSPGTHLFGYRAYQVDDDFVTHYAPTVQQEVEIVAENRIKVYVVEYFWDEDPGLGKGKRIAVNPDTEISFNNIEISTEGLAKGTHLLGLRAMSGIGWGPTLMQEVFVPTSTSDGADIARVEYFWDTDPGFGKGKPLPIAPGQEVSLENLVLSTEGVPYGDRVLNIRSYGNDSWGPTLQTVVRVEPDAAHNIVSNAEYFWNEDPGFGQGTPINITPGATVELTNLQVPSEDVHGDAMLYIRYRGPMGWSATKGYLVLVNANGDYTLDTNSETSLEQRNYQSLADAFDDFADRDISDNITITVTTADTEYTLDATDDECLEQITKIAQNLEALSVERGHKTIAFTAAEGSGNSLAITTTAKGLPTVLGLFAQTSLENVSLTINGTAYDFTAATQRYEECCGSTSTVALSGISTAVKASWQALPHEGTVLSGFPAKGNGNLPAMTLTNNSSDIDSLACQVTLSTKAGVEFYSYTYYIYVHARMANQSFTTVFPVPGTDVDPVDTPLQWNAFNDAVGYRVVVTEAAEGEEPVEVVNVETEQNSYDLTVKAGYSYTYTVTAIGHCDELTSKPMTFKGRLLPDFVVESISLPEGAPSGSVIEVKATIRNQGEGASTEGEWTDRLFYVLDSSNFSDAIEALNVQHTGDIPVNGTYEATFQMQVPYVETGTLRVFVQANADGAALESNADNNHMLSPTSATLTPVYMNADDLAVLRQFYKDFGGDHWTGTPWKTSSELITSNYWSGVTFDADCRVTGINLDKRNVTGSLSTATPLNLPRLTTLRLSENALTGDPAKFITTEGVPQLKSLYLSKNQIDELSAPLSATITTLALDEQHPTGLYSSDFYFSVGNNISMTLPAVAGYNHQTQTLNNHPALNVHLMSSPYYSLGQLQWSNVNDRYTYVGGNWNGHSFAQDDTVVLRPASGAAVNSAYCGQIHLTFGDANMTGWVDVNDVQRTLNYVINSNNWVAFNMWCADTWEDERINIQDIVCTVNIVLDNQGDGARYSPRRMMPTKSANRFFAADRYVYLESKEEIAAFYLEIEGVTATQVKLLLNKSDWQMVTRDTETGASLVVFSPTGQTLPTGQTQLLRLGGTGTPVAAQASNAMAENVAVNVAYSATGIVNIQPADNEAPAYDLQGRKLNNEQMHKGLYIKNGKKMRK